MKPFRVISLKRSWLEGGHRRMNEANSRQSASAATWRRVHCRAAFAGLVADERHREAVEIGDHHFPVLAGSGGPAISDDPADVALGSDVVAAGRVALVLDP